MDRRFEERHLTDMDVCVTRLTQPARSGHGKIADISNSGVCVTVPFELADGDIVQLEIDGSNLFGFVAHVSPEGTTYRVGIEVQRVLIGGSDLSRVLRLALQRALPGVPGVLAGTPSA